MMSIERSYFADLRPSKGHSVRGAIFFPLKAPDGSVTAYDLELTKRGCLRVGHTTDVLVSDAESHLFVEKRRRLLFKADATEEVAAFRRILRNGNLSTELLEWLWDALLGVIERRHTPPQCLTGSLADLERIVELALAAVPGWLPNGDPAVAVYPRRFYVCLGHEPQEALEFELTMGYGPAFDPACPLTRVLDAAVRVLQPVGVPLATTPAGAITTVLYKISRAVESAPSAHTRLPALGELSKIWAKYRKLPPLANLLELG
jgi:hypothetical protein